MTLKFHHASGGIFLASAAAAICGTLLLAGCGGAKKNAVAPHGYPAAPVHVAKVVETNIPNLLPAIGTVQPISTINIKSQIAGELRQVYFRQGQPVRRGQRLLEIDPRPYEAALEQAQAALQRDQASARQAAMDAARYAQLFKEGIISQQQNQQQQSTLAGLQASVRADQAAIKNARIQLSYTQVNSPINGLTGTLQIQPGNLIKANDLPIVTITQMSPIYISFSVPEQSLAEIRREMARHPLIVQAELGSPGAAGTTSAAAGQNERGRLSFINNSVDTATGTINLMASFPNTDQRLWPGQYVNVNLVLNTIRHALTVPSQAVQLGQQGKYAYTVSPQQTAQLHILQVGPEYRGLTVVLHGLKAGETVVTDGQLRLLPGAKVQVLPPSRAAGAATAGAAATGL